MNHTFKITAALLAVITFEIGFQFGKQQEAKKHPKFDLPEEPIGLGATIRKPDTLLAYQLTGEDTIRLVYYDRNRILGECDSANYPFLK